MGQNDYSDRPTLLKIKSIHSKQCVKDSMGPLEGKSSQVKSTSFIQQSILVKIKFKYR